MFADEIAVKLADEATEADRAKKEEGDQRGQSEPTLNDLKKGLDELKSILITRKTAALPTAQVPDNMQHCSTLSVLQAAWTVRGDHYNNERGEREASPKKH